MQLLELVRGKETTDETYETITKRGVEFCRSDPKQIQEILPKLI